MLTVFAFMLSTIALAEKFVIVGCSNGSVIHVSKSTPSAMCRYYDQSVEKVYVYTGHKNDERLFMAQTIADFDEYLKRKSEESDDSEEFSSDIKIEKIKNNGIVTADTPEDLARKEVVAQLGEGKKTPLLEKEEVPTVSTKSIPLLKKKPVETVEDDSLFVEAAAAAAEKNKQREAQLANKLPPVQKQDEKSEFPFGRCVFGFFVVGGILNVLSTKHKWIQTAFTKLAAALAGLGGGLAAVGFVSLIVCLLAARWSGADWLIVGDGTLPFFGFVALGVGPWIAVHGVALGKAVKVQAHRDLTASAHEAGWWWVPIGFLDTAIVVMLGLAK
jgi:hypothetical protein